MNAAPFPIQRLSTEDVPRRNRLDFVHDFIGRHVGGLDLRPADRDDIRIDLQAMQLPGGLTIGRTLYPPMRGARTRYLLQDGREHYALTIHRKDCEISVDGREPLKISAGDVVLVNEAVCFEFVYGKRMSGDLVSLDRQLLTRLVPGIGIEANYVIPSTSASLPLLLNYVEMLRRHSPNSIRAGEVASRHIYDLAALVLDGFVRGGADRSETSIAAARLKLIRKDILERLSDHTLHIDDVAQRQGVTPRYIQRLLESEGTTFTDFVRDCRLDLAFRLLQERGAASSMITTIAYDVGFADLSSFSRAFRRRFNATPSEIRASIIAKQVDT